MNEPGTRRRHPSTTSDGVSGRGHLKTPLCMESSGLDVDPVPDFGVRRAGEGPVSRGPV